VLWFQAPFFGLEAQTKIFSLLLLRRDCRDCFAWTFAVYSPMLILMSFGIQRRKLFVVECKRCRRDVPAGVAAFPFQSIVVACPLCGELRRYLPSEVALGTPHHLVAKQARAGQS
jgi:hypothetical protein